MTIKGRHETPSIMLLESLDETLFTVNQCLNYRKLKASLWPKPHALGGILGFPATTLLFSLVDTIGSYCDNLEVNVQGNIKTIKATTVHTHFFILNSKYFGLNLSEKDIEKIFKCVRSTLSHNSIIGKEILLHPGSSDPFIKVNQFEGKGKYTIYLKSFYEACFKAVKMFKEDIPNIVPNSLNGKDFKV